MLPFSKNNAINLFLFSLLLFIPIAIYTQVGIGTTTPAPSAQLDVSSTTKGFLPPRMTQAQRNAIPSPAPGLMIWCSDCGLSGEISIYNGTAWGKSTGRVGKNYYVSSLGDDTKDGLTEANAWQTLAAVNNYKASFNPGDSILFKRGSYFYGQIIIESSGTAANPIVFGAYSSGKKPVFIGAKQINDVSLQPYQPWINKGGKIYEKQDGTFDKDVANLIFNNIDSFVGKKIMSTTGQLQAQGEFWFDFNTRKLTLYSESDPQTFYTSIQSVKSMNAIEFNNASYIIFDNLNFKFYGYCVVEIGGSNCSFRNLDISYIGGGNNNPEVKNESGVVIKTAREYYDDNIPYQQWGNGLQMWEGVHDVTITGCKIDNIYDAGISPQGLSDFPFATYNLYMRNNVISNCVYSFEFFETGYGAYKSPRKYNDNITCHDIYFENNTCINAGGGWGYKQRPNKWATHVRFAGLDGTKSNIFIRNNIFYGAKERLYWIIFPSYYDVSNMISNYNLFYQDNTHYGKPIGTLYANDKEATGGNEKDNYYTLENWKVAILNASNSTKENSSISLDPLFLSYPSDLHLQAGSPAIGNGIDVGYGKDMGAFPFKGN